MWMIFNLLLMVEVLQMKLHVAVAILNMNTHSSHYHKTSSHLSELPPDIPPLTTHLDLSDNKFIILSRLGDYSAHLLLLRFADNPIELITPGVFSRCSSLQELWLGGTKIVRLENDTFQGLARLQTLNMDSNQWLKVIDFAAFRGLLTLKELHLSDSKIRQFPCLGPYTPELEVYESVRNKYQQTLDDICLNGLSNLTSFKIGTYGHESSTKSNITFDFADSLVSLDVNNIDLGEMNHRLRHCTHLSYLQLRKARLTAFPISNLIEKKIEITLIRNDIDCVTTEDLKLVPNVSSLKIIHSPLEVFPSLTCGKQDTSEILSNGTQRVLLPHLKHLALKHASLTSLDTFDRFIATDLRIIVLIYNNISHVNPYVFGKFPKLTELNLDCNQIVGIEIGGQLALLSDIHLNKNRLSYFRVMNNSDLPSLEYLGLRHNSLEALSPLDLRSFNSNRSLSSPLRIALEGNALHCDEGLCWLLASGRINVKGARCSTPESLAGLLYQDIAKEHHPCCTNKSVTRDDVCDDPCPPGYYRPDLSTKTRCAPCAAQCAECEQEAGRCLNCHAGFNVLATSSNKECQPDTQTSATQGRVQFELRECPTGSCTTTTEEGVDQIQNKDSITNGCFLSMPTVWPIAILLSGLIG